MKRFRDWRIETKLSLIIMLTNATALALVSALLIAQYARSARAQTEADLETLALVVGNNAQAALSFMDPMDAADILGALTDKQNIVSARLFDSSGEPFAAFAREEEQPPGKIENYREPTTLEWERGVLVYAPVILNDALIGVIALKADLSDLRQIIAHNVRWAAIITLGALVFAFLLVSPFQHIILRPIKQMVVMASRIADGMMPELLPGITRDEIGELERAFNRMADSNRHIVQSAQKLSHGNYAIDLKPRSEHDELTLSLIRMTEALVRFNEESQYQNWLKGGLSELSDQMRGEFELPELCDRILRFLTGYLDAQIGVFFIAEEETTLKALAGFGVRNESGPPMRVKWGEGPIGEAAARRRAFKLGEKTGLSFRVDFGYCQVLPRHIHAQPLVCEGTIAGVIQLGFMKPPGKRSEDFLEQAAAAIAVTIRSSMARVRERDLFEKIRSQSEALQQQQEELRQTNVELEERAELLEKERRDARAELRAKAGG